MSARRGLPEVLQPRYEKHYVESLGDPLPEPLGQLVLVSDIVVNKDQPRFSLGDLSGLKSSIESKGIIEPIIVRRLDGAGKYQIISGERRYSAAVELGLLEVPCVIREADDKETLELALIENLQRKDLTPFEEADGLKQLVERYGFSHEEVAKRIGKSRSSITESLSLARIPADVRSLCGSHGIEAKSMLLQLARQETASDMLSLVESIINRGITRKEARSFRPKMATARPKPFTFRYKPADKSYAVTVRFGKTEASQEEVMAALKEAARKASGE